MRFWILHIILFWSTAAFSQSAGRVGATQLLINPWVSSAGEGGAGTAFGSGLEMTYMNPAGIEPKEKSELIFSRMNWLQGSQIYINTFGISQKFNEKSSLALSIMSFNMGDIEITTADNPEGGIGTYRPQFINGGVTYARNFENKISGGLTLKFISEAIHNVGAFGMALDAGIKYISGEKENVSFGLALKNVGPNMRYNGNGLKMQLTFPNGNTQTGEVAPDSYALPLIMNMGFGYRKDFSQSHSLQSGFTYSGRMFLNDQTRVGLVYSFKNFLDVRLGLVHEKGIFSNQRQTAITGPSGGFSFQIPYGKNNQSFGFNYSYRDTNPFEGVHAFGARIIL